MSQEISTRKRRRTLVAVLGLAFMLAAAAIPAHAADDDEEDLTFEQKLLRQLLGGILSPGADIDYRERSPLVVPPTRDLPTPDKGAVAASNPAWPVDADVKRRKDDAKQRREARRSQSPNEEGRALRPDELNVARKPGAGRVTGSLPTEADRMTPNELGYKGGLWSSWFGFTKKDQPVAFSGEPPRSSLIEPPPGYRTPSPNQPYGVLTEEKYTPKAFNVMDKPTGGP
jgi:hypothetical protein